MRSSVAVTLQGHSGTQREMTACLDTHGFAHLLLPFGFLQPAMRAASLASMY